MDGSAVGPGTANRYPTEKPDGLGRAIPKLWSGREDLNPRFPRHVSCCPTGCTRHSPRELVGRARIGVLALLPPPGNVDDECRAPLLLGVSDDVSRATEALCRATVPNGNEEVRVIDYASACAEVGLLVRADAV